MQKSKNATIVILIAIFTYGLLGSIKLVKDINTIYLYIINPIKCTIFTKNAGVNGSEITNTKLLNFILLITDKNLL